jgi:hypothetical protein
MNVLLCIVYSLLDCSVPISQNVCHECESAVFSVPTALGEYDILSCRFLFQSRASK